MPRKARIDAPGALHHIIIRGIERKDIFRGDQDRESFVARLGRVLLDTSTPCFAWVLLSNHAHFLLRTGVVPIATVMRRLLTGYAQEFNRRYRRHGQLFQNRYKSILCDEEPYLLELVRYIHLNPIRAKLVADYKALSKYVYCGHGVILERQKRSWQDIEYVLGLFDEDKGMARRRYRQFVRKGIEQGKRPDLIGGGLVRSQGGWAAVKALRKVGSYQKGDERILGGSTFVEQVLSQANEQMEQKYRLAAEGFDLDWAVERVAELMDMSPEDVMDSGKGRRCVQARGILCYWATDQLGISQSRLAGILNLSQPAISQAVNRGKRLAKMHKYSLIEEKNL